MKKRTTIFRRFFVQFASLLLLISLNSYSYTDQTGGGSGVNILQSVGSCSGVSSSGSLSGSEDSSEESSGNFITGEPVDIPAPIAKGIDGIDPTSVTFDSVGGSGLIKAQTKEVLAQSDSDTAGTLSFSTTSGSDLTAVLIEDGAVVDSTLTTGGDGSFTITNGQIDKSLVIGALSDTSTLDDIDSISSQYVIVTISEVNDELVANVSITNIASGTGASFDGEITNREIAFNGTRVAFNARDSSDNPLIATVELDDFEPQILVNDIAVELDFLTGADTALFGVDAEGGSGTIFSIAGDGTTFDDSSNPNTPSIRSFCISPDLNWIASNIDTVEGGEAQMAINLLSLIDPLVDIVVPTSAPEPETITNIMCDWADTTSIVVSKRYEDLTYAIEYYDLNDIINGSAVNVTPEVIVAQQAAFLAAPDVDPAVDSRLVFQCGVPTTDIQLCRIDPVDDFVLMFDDPVFVGTHRYNADGSGVVFELSLTSDVTDVDNTAIVFVNSDTLEATYLAKGVKPVPSPTDKNIIVFLAPVGDTLQISILNLDNFNL